MIVLVAFTVGLVFWISAWALGAKAFDAFMVTIALTVGAAAVHVLGPYLRRALGIEEQPPRL